ncbi:MAG: trehalose-phosphatase [Alphaproteobacteria bacterium]|nr:trehalose-phosphatase [Alphaproteobacteria bacterium]MBU0797333.1 trehalose-phosphatase [Alphaproteobacteria bacterium]MBU0886899.1 trehalose-phosphatase [Alphaproteobacteria bacterium]MBU1812358.1 trehalose-phosphatase [Alphaproteobacteria bacterium]MBU2090492.1 trehalose-phosphatase [Alphaproteobacteria bacterium]
MAQNTLQGLRLEDTDALFIDFDGTLAEIGPDPDAIRLAPGMEQVLQALCQRLNGAVAILSGRDIRDLSLRIPSLVWRAGGHGLEVMAPGVLPPAEAPPPPPAAVLAPLEAVVDSHPGVRIELKGPIAAVHYRAAPDAETACVEAAQNAASVLSGWVFQRGKMVVEVKPAHAHKGRALQSLASAAPFAGRRPVMLGDDTTDEDAFVAAQALGGIGVKIGEGISAARLRTPDPASVRAWLTQQAGL